MLRSPRLALIQVVVVDDEDRENEGDLIMAVCAQFVCLPVHLFS